MLTARTVALALVALLSVSGCQLETADARALAERYLMAVSSGEADFGWSLLHPETRATVFDDDYSSYEERMAGADWSRFEWVVVEVVADDPSLHIVRLRPGGDDASVPSEIVDIGRWSLLHPGPDATYTMDVRIGVPWGPSGVWAIGG